MAATKTQIELWLDALYSGPDYTHMIVACDTWDWEDFPVYVKQDQDVHERESELKQGATIRIMEVYSKNHDREAQLAEYRAHHYD